MRLSHHTLLVAGAAAGMSVTFAATVASVIFAMELLIFEFKSRSLLAVLLMFFIYTVEDGFKTLPIQWIAGAGAILATQSQSQLRHDIVIGEIDKCDLLHWTPSTLFPCILWIKILSRSFISKGGVYARCTLKLAHTVRNLHIPVLDLKMVGYARRVPKKYIKLRQPQFLQIGKLSVSLRRTSAFCAIATTGFCSDKPERISSRARLRTSSGFRTGIA